MIYEIFLRNRLMLFCRLFLPAVGQGSSAVVDFSFLARKGLIKGTDMYPCSLLPFSLAQFKIRPHFSSQIGTLLRKIVIFFEK